jgi:phosphoribosylformylglycinamidine synthase
MLNHIQLVLKDNINDTKGFHLEKKCADYFSIATGKIKTGKIFSINYQLSESEILLFARNALADAILHDVFINKMYQNDFYQSYILVAKLPGVTDDEGISAQKALKDILDVDIDLNTQHIFSQEMYLIEKDLPSKQLQKIAENLLGNPLINHFEFGKFADSVHFVPEVKIPVSQPTQEMNLNVSDSELMTLSQTRLLSLNLEEMKAIQRNFQLDKTKKERQTLGLPENPTDCELEILAQTWSEHCKHKEFSATIHYKNHETGEEITIDSLFKTYIKASTEMIQKKLIEHNNNWLLKVFSDNAGVVKINDESVFVWKVETHNSPSAIDPYGGAITGILGNNRDPLGTGIGGAKLLFNTNVLCFGSPNYDKELLQGQLHPKRIFQGVRHGIEDGGNKSGIPTVNGSIIFDERYSGKPLVYCGTGGVMPMQYIDKNTWEKPISAGDLIIMAGGRVGKDGIHGATFSSVELDEHSPQSAVQIGSPITQKLLGDFLFEAANSGLIKCSTDNGAGGLSSSIGELAQISYGATVELSNVPLKYPNLAPWEIFVSESQERMTLVVETGKYDELKELAEKREVELSQIGYFTDSGMLEVNYENKPIAALSLDFLYEGTPKKTLFAEWKKPELSEPALPDFDYSEMLLKLLADENICSRESVIRQYDHEVKGKTILKPLMGKTGKAPQDAAVMRFNHDSYEGIAISNGILPRYGDIDAYEMAAGSFDEAIRQIISVGGKLPDFDEPNHFWSVNDNFCVPDSVFHPETNPDGKEKLAKLVQMNKALYDMATFFSIPMTSGKDSMKNDFKAGNVKISVPPTILFSMTAKIPDVRKTNPSMFLQSGDLIYQIGKTYDELGASIYYQQFNEIGANVPKVRKEDTFRVYQKIAQANEQNLIESSHDISDGGLAVAIAECCFGNELGANIEMERMNLSKQALLFSESHSRFIVTIRPENKTQFEEIFGEDTKFIGNVTQAKVLSIKIDKIEVISLPVNDLMTAWNRDLLA